MKWLKQHKKWIIIALVLAAVLALAYWYGGGSPESRGWQTPSPELSAAQPQTAAAAVTLEQTPTLGTETEAEVSEPKQKVEPDPASQSSMDVEPETGKDQYQTDPTPEGKPVPVEPETVTTESSGGTCTVSISCATILNNMDLCDADKHELVPADGVILPATSVSFSQGESVFDLLLRVCQSNGIHMEYVNTPMYNSAYIEGIANLYEFDVGELSGWMYKVNDWFPNYGCSRYQLEDGDVVAWLYTCDLGYDVGGGYAAGE